MSMRPTTVRGQMARVARRKLATNRSAISVGGINDG